MINHNYPRNQQESLFGTGPRYTIARISCLLDHHADRRSPGHIRGIRATSQHEAAKMRDEEY